MNAESHVFDQSERHKLRELVRLANGSAHSGGTPDQVEAVKCAIRELEGEKEDDYFDAASAMVPDLATGRVLHRCWESVAQCFPLSCHQFDGVVQLFSIAAIVQTVDAMTPTEFEEILDYSVHQLETSPKYISTRCELGPVRIDPRVFTAGDLLSLRKFQLRAWARSLGIGGATLHMNTQEAPHVASKGIWRARTFLRFMVGGQVVSAFESDVNDSAGCEGLTRRIASALSALPTSTTMHYVTSDGTFFGPLWTGLRRYQLLRSGECALRAVAKCDRGESLVATLSAHGVPQDYRLVTAFFDGVRQDPIRVYVALERPFCESTRVVKCLSNRLRDAGVSRIAVFPAICPPFNGRDRSIQCIGPEGMPTRVPYLLPL